MNFYKHHIGDYAAATAHLTFSEDAAFSRLLRIYYRDEKPLPTEIRAVQRLCGARAAEELEAVETVLNEFFSLTADGWRNKRCDEEIAKAQAQAETNRAIAEAREERKRAAIQPRKEHESCNESLNGSSLLREPSQTPDSRLQTRAEEVRATVQPAVARGRFGDFWLVYPVKKGKAAAEKKWRAMRLDPHADQIIAHVRLMQTQDDDWRRGFIPHGSTYINGQRWLDEPTHARRDVAPQQTSKTMQAIMNLEAMKSGNRMAGGRVVDGDAEIALLGFGEATGNGGFAGNGSGVD